MAGYTLDPTYNELFAGSVYPTAGATVGLAATGVNQRFVSNGTDMYSYGGGGGGGGVAASSGYDDGTDAQAGTASAMPAGSFVGGLIVFLIGVVLLMVIGRRFGAGDEDFRNIRSSAYNALWVGGVAVVAIPVIKVGVIWMADMGVPFMDHAATWVLAA